MWMGRWRINNEEEVLNVLNFNKKGYMTTKIIVKAQIYIGEVGWLERIMDIHTNIVVYEIVSLKQQKNLNIGLLGVENWWCAVLKSSTSTWCNAYIEECLCGTF